ncbi:thiamin pyrophosphokinase 1-like [Oscarella lobularis]|uniref:thiamin pyrophosphokinase 1-like n=1 Tax=Oscarella lobularis TaxID=121494 RepID=UPI0033131B6C
MSRWQGPSYLERSHRDGDAYALVMLHTDVNMSKDALFRLWEDAEYRVCADGAANQLRSSSSVAIPDLICGDFDSAEPSTIAYYRNMGCDIQYRSCQDTTDFTKCLQELHARKTEGKTEYDSILVLCSTGGRLDHVMAIVQTLYIANDMEPDIPVLLVSDNSLSFLLQPGHHVINVKSKMRGDWCGLVPMGKPCERVTTSGLKWNLNNQCLAFGELVSTSNTFSGDYPEEVTVETDAPLLWTMGIVWNA